MEDLAALEKAPALVERARALILLFDPEGYEEAVPLLRAAIEADPSCAAAFAALSETYSYWGFRRQIAGQESQSLYAMAYDYAKMAVRLAPDRADCHRAMAVSLRRGRRKSDHETRAQEIALALELDPQDPESWAEQWRVNGYSPDDEALARALALAPGLCSLHIDLGAVHCEAGRFDDAIAELRRALQINPRNSLAFYDLAMVLDRKGERAKAALVLRKAESLRPKEPLIESGLEIVEDDSHG